MFKIKYLSFIACVHVSMAFAQTEHFPVKPVRVIVPFARAAAWI